MRTFRIFFWVGALAGLLAAQGTAPAAPPTLDLAQALQRARANSPEFQTALANAGIARAQQTEAKAALLPAASYDNSYLFTERNIYVANDGPHEYQSWLNLHERLDFAGSATWKRAQAGVALAQAQAQVAARGLVAAVTQNYYQALAAGHKVETAQQALRDAQSYLKISQEREASGEVAHADVIKAEIEAQQKQRDLAEAALNGVKARLALGVLVFSDFTQRFDLVDDLDQAPPLPAQDHIEALAGIKNPDLAAARAELGQAGEDVAIAHAALLPSLSLDYFYGIDAHQFAARNAEGERNLGFATIATLNIPLFDWGANRAKAKQAALQQSLARTKLSSAQRQLLANLAGDYAEAQAAHQELASLASTRDLAAESLRLTGLRYQNGDATILELVDAQNTLTQARNAYDDGEVRYRVALANLQTLTGSF